MQRTLFTRIQPIDLYINSEQTVSFIIDIIIAKSAQDWMMKQIKRISPQIITQQIMDMENCIARQAFMSNQQASRLSEDWEGDLFGRKYKKQIYQSNRPFSAKVQWQSKHKDHFAKKYLLHKPSKKTSTNKSISLARKQSNKLYKMKTQPQRFVALPSKLQNEDSFDESYINSLREIKFQQLKYFKSKQQFMKTLHQQNDHHQKLNKNFLQIMGNKSYYYNKNGENIEINRNKLIKKNINCKIILKVQNSKRTANEVKTETKVSYRQKLNSPQRYRQTITLDDKEQIFFYKSQNCNYHMIS